MPKSRRGSRVPAATIEAFQQTQQELADHILMLQQENEILNSNIQAIREDLVLATQTTLGRMLIEVGTAARDLRESLPVEGELEDGELMEEKEPGMSRWKLRLDKMILKISQAHRKADEELQAISHRLADTRSGSQKSVHPDGVLDAGSSKRSWASSVRDIVKEEAGSAIKRGGEELLLRPINVQDPKKEEW
ncbi:hypothetical protein EG329_012867 [Mollisiaceae sp. DMI_Dod_QoI]|nr:hypothetical protein EG329_012867 [Helotiales sp. DMI_Dod_QoI]